jgi:hypothetical protein
MGADAETLNLFVRRDVPDMRLGSVEVAPMRVLYVLCRLDKAYCTVTSGRVYCGD